MQAWDTITTSALAWTAIVTPFEVALLEPPIGWDTAFRAPLFVINRLIDLIFFVDMMLQFMLMVQSYSDREGVKWIEYVRPIPIQRHLTPHPFLPLPSAAPIHLPC